MISPDITIFEFIVEVPVPVIFKSPVERVPENAPFPTTDNFCAGVVVPIPTFSLNTKRVDVPLTAVPVEE
jgi:hypothetical protein